MKFLTVKEVAVLLGIHEQSVYNLVRKKGIPYLKIPGAGIRFKGSGIQKWVEENHHKPSPLAEILPKFDIALDGYDKIHLKRRTELKNGFRWTYGIGSVILRKTKNKEERFYIHYQMNGQRVRKVLKGVKTRSEAVKVLNAEITDAIRGKYDVLNDKKKITFDEMSEIYLEKYSKPKKRSWKSADRVSIRNMKPFFGSILLHKITPLKIEDYKMKRLENGTGRRRGEKVSNSTINRELQCLRKLFNKAIDWGYALKNPVMKVDFLSEKGSIRKRVLSEDEEVRLIDAAALHLKHMLIVALNTGMRKGEVLKLKWENVDFKEREITIVETKDNEDRIMPMNPLLLSLLLTLKSQDGKSKYVFTNPQTGKHYVEIKRAFTSALKKAGIEDFHFHDLRHTYASRLVRNGTDLNTVKELLGHSSITTTQRYLHSQVEQKRAAVNSLSGHKYDFSVQWQKSDKLPLTATEDCIVNSSYLTS